MTQNWLKILLAIALGGLMVLNAISASDGIQISSDNTRIENVSSEAPFTGAPILPVSTCEEENFFADLPVALALFQLCVDVASQSVWRSHIAGKDYQKRLERPPQPVC